jgi:glycine oxidase
MRQSRYDLVICGGGVIGLSIAYYCAKQGWNVLLMDSQKLAQGASWAGAGILPSGASQRALDPLEQLRAMSHRLHPEWARQLREETGIDTEYRRCGGLYLARTLGERATLSAQRTWWEEHGIPFESWDAETLRDRTPGIAIPTAQAWWLPNDARLRNPRHLKALVQACQKSGVALMENHPITGFEIKGDQIISAVSEKGCEKTAFQGDRYCIASGAWASRLLGTMGIETGILPVRGQMILYRLEEKPFDFVINDGHRYLMPRDDGHVLAGSCEEEVGFACHTTDSMLDELQGWADELCPKLRRDRVVQTWAGLRPGSFDTYPYLGTLPFISNGFVASGHFRHGLHWSTATAVLMYQWMNGDQPEIDLQPFCVQRGKTLGAQMSNKKNGQPT